MDDPADDIKRALREGGISWWGPPLLALVLLGPAVLMVAAVLIYGAVFG